MHVEFLTRRLAKQCADARSRRKAFGAERARRLEARLHRLQSAENLAEVVEAGGRLHRLTGDRAGQLSLDLDGPYRLLLEPILEPGGARSDRPWQEITCVRLLSITDTHA